MISSGACRQHRALFAAQLNGWLVGCTSAHAGLVRLTKDEPLLHVTLL